MLLQQYIFSLFSYSFIHIRGILSQRSLVRDKCSSLISCIGTVMLATPIQKDFDIYGPKYGIAMIHFFL